MQQPADISAVRRASMQTPDTGGRARQGGPSASTSPSSSCVRKAPRSARRPPSGSAAHLVQSQGW